jgi:hypothetical protein
MPLATMMAMVIHPDSRPRILLTVRQRISGISARWRPGRCCFDQVHKCGSHTKVLGGPEAYIKFGCHRPPTRISIRWHERSPTSNIIRRQAGFEDDKYPPFFREIGLPGRFQQTPGQHRCDRQRTRGGCVPQERTEGGSHLLKCRRRFGRIIPVGVGRSGGIEWCGRATKSTPTSVGCSICTNCASAGCCTSHTPVAWMRSTNAPTSVGGRALSKCRTFIWDVPGVKGV